MPINKDLSDLPKDGAERSPMRPSRTPQVVNALAEAWFKKYQEGDPDNKPHAIPGTTFRLSSTSNRCDRQAYLAMAKVPRSNPNTIADSWRMNLGQMVHTGLQTEIAELGDGWRSEIVVDLNAIGINGSGSLDLVRFVNNRTGEPMQLFDSRLDLESADEGGREYRYSSDIAAPESKWLRVGEWDPEVEKPVAVAEVKTINGFSFKMIATDFKGAAQGPRWAHVLQGGLGALALGVPDLFVGYLSLENISADMAKSFSDDETGRFTAEWHFDVETLRPALEEEVRRIKRIISLVEAGVVPAREIHDPELPTGAIIVDPEHRGRWQVTQDAKVVQSGTTWFCGYCSHRDTCVAMGPDGNASGLAEQLLEF